MCIVCENGIKYDIDFEERLDNLISIYLNYLSLVGMSSEKLFDLFARKMSVNLFRIRTGY